MTPTERDCKKCRKVLPFSAFHKHKSCKYGIYSVCKECREPVSKANYAKWTEEYRMLHGVKSRAAQRGMEFDLSLEDIVIPEVCPVFGVPLVKGTRYAASIDRIDNSRGYTKDNIVIMSTRANLLKNDGTQEEFEQLCSYLAKSNHD